MVPYIYREKMVQSYKKGVRTVTFLPEVSCIFRGSHSFGVGPPATVRPFVLGVAHGGRSGSPSPLGSTGRDGGEGYRSCR